MNDDFEKKDFSTTCRDCKKPIMMRYSKNKDKYYPTDLPGDYKTFHSCKDKVKTEKKVKKETSIDQAGKVCPLMTKPAERSYCLVETCAWYVPTEKVCAIMFLWTHK